jgi:hypothetical protein
MPEKRPENASLRITKKHSRHDRRFLHSDESEQITEETLFDAKNRAGRRKRLNLLSANNLSQVAHCQHGFALCLLGF